MNIFDILGPVMVGPSSSHTAGAVKIGLVSRKLLGEDVKQVVMLLHGSFAATGMGHGTDKALVAGLLGMNTDDENIPISFDIAKEHGVSIKKGTVELRNVHPNSVLLQLTGVSGDTLEIVGSSLGGGRIRICRIDDVATDFTGDYPTLIIRNSDKPGPVAHVTSILLNSGVNIANMHLYRNSRGGYAAMVIESDHNISPTMMEDLAKIDGIIKVVCLDL